MFPLHILSRDHSAGKRIRFGSCATYQVAQYQQLSNCVTCTWMPFPKGYPAFRALKQLHVHDLKIGPMDIQSISINHELRGLRQILAYLVIHLIARIYTQRAPHLRFDDDSSRLADHVLPLVNVVSKKVVVKQIPRVLR